MPQTAQPQHLQHASFLPSSRFQPGWLRAVCLFRLVTIPRFNAVYWLWLRLWFSLSICSPHACFGQQTVESEYTSRSPLNFCLPAVDSATWFSAQDFRGQPLVLVHFSSWSPSTRRLLPLWYQRLKPWIQRNIITVVVIAHEPHATRAKLFCQQQGIDVLLLHDALTIAVGHGDRQTELPWAMLFDGMGNLQHARLTLNQLEKQLSSNSELPKQNLNEPKQNSIDPNFNGRSLEDVLEARLRHGDPLVENTSPQEPDLIRADMYLRQALVDAGPQGNHTLTVAISQFEQQWQNAPSAELAYRLALANYRAFQLSNGAHVSAFQRAMQYLHWSYQRQSAAFLGAWARSLGPQVEKDLVAYDWLSPALESARQQNGTSIKPFRLGPVFNAEQLGPSLNPLLELSPLPTEPTRIRTTPVPWGSVQVDSVWIPSLEPAQAWSRLYLRIYLKRGTWLLDSAAELEWSMPDFSDGSEPRWIDLHTQAAGANDDVIEVSEANEVSEVWLETDVWFPPDLFHRLQNVGRLPIPGEPPSTPRNAQLRFRGRDPLTGQVEWRQINFHLPLPEPIRN